MENTSQCEHYVVKWDSSNSSFDSYLRSKICGCFSKNTFCKRFPVFNWLPRYNSTDALGDLIAGVTVGLTVIPQSLAYSTIVGLPSQYGLYGSFFGAFIYIIFGSCKEVPIGPAAITAIMTYETIGARGLSLQHAVLLTFFTGVIELLMGLLGLGFIIQFISGPVSSGFTSAVALVIFTSQIKDIFIIKVTGNTFLEQWISIFKEIHNASLYDAILGISCIVLLLLIRVFGFLQVGPKDENDQSLLQKIVNKIIWSIGALRNILIIVICGGIGFALSRDQGISPIKLMGFVPPGLPEIKHPPFGFTSGNETVTFMKMMSDLGSGLIIVPLIGLLENIAICKAFANGKTVDASQELIAIGLCNIGNSFLQAYPTTGSVPRAAVNHASGVRTPFGGLYTGLLVILSLLFFTPYFAYIPKASLAAVIIAAVIFMVEFHVVKPIWRIKKSDMIPGVGTFIFCLIFPLQLGILLGIALNLLFVLHMSARPRILSNVYTSGGGNKYLVLTPDRYIIFPSVDSVYQIVMKNSLEYPTLPVVMDCTYIYDVDYTGAKTIQSLYKTFELRGQRMMFYNPNPGVLKILTSLNYQDRIIEKFQLIDRLYEAGIMKTIEIS